MGIRAALVVLMLLLPATAQAKVFDDPNENPIVAENVQQGTTRWDIAPPDHPAIEGYASETSVAPGQRFHLHVNPGSPNDRYRIYVYRIGWYGGDCGRLVTRIPRCDSGEDAQPPPPHPRRPQRQDRATPAAPAQAGSRHGPRERGLERDRHDRDAQGLGERLLPR